MSLIFGSRAIRSKEKFLKIESLTAGWPNWIYALKGSRAHATIPLYSGVSFNHIPAIKYSRLHFRFLLNLLIKISRSKVKDTNVYKFYKYMLLCVYYNNAINDTRLTFLAKMWSTFCSTLPTPSCHSASHIVYRLDAFFEIFVAEAPVKIKFIAHFGNYRGSPGPKSSICVRFCLA